MVAIAAQVTLQDDVVAKLFSNAPESLPFPVGAVDGDTVVPKTVGRGVVSPEVFGLRLGLVDVGRGVGDCVGCRVSKRDVGPGVGGTVGVNVGAIDG